MTPLTHVMDFESFCAQQEDRIRRELFPPRQNAGGQTLADEDLVYTRTENAEDEWHPSTKG